MEPEYEFQHKYNCHQQNATKLDNETDFGMALPAEHNRQRQAKNRGWRNIVHDLIDDFHTAFRQTHMLSRKTP